jgi:oligopeptide/dipeptide ABC transporter ATP-binding protein
MALLDLEGLEVWLPGRRGAQQILMGIDLHIEAGECIGIAGESGSGKSITALSLLGLLPQGAVTRGRARFDGVDLLRMRGRERQRIRGAGIGIVFQDPKAALHPMLTIGTQLTEHLRHHRGLRKAAAEAHAAELLDVVHLPDPLNALRWYPHQLSGGMLQRVAIAVALACDPKLLIADEPTTALDVTVQAQILRLLDELRRERELSVLLISHDLGVMSAIGERLYVLYAGRVVESGRVRELITEPWHPYTQALLQCLPDPAHRVAELVPIPGAPPRVGAYPSGCPFHPRCRHAVESCTRDVPPLLQVGKTRLSRCPVVLEAPMPATASSRQ